MPASRWGSAPGLWRRRLLLRQAEKRIQGFPVVAGENRAPAIRRIARGASARRVLAPGRGSAPACQLRVLLLRQVEKRIDGFAVVADLEMQLVAVGAGAAHLGDLLARLHPLALGYQALAVVAVGRQP